MVDLGRVLDRDDTERAETGKHSEFYGLGMDTLRRKFLGDTIAELHNQRTTLLTGPAMKVSSNMIPFLYFFPSISLQLCPRCPQVQNPKLIEPFLERRVISIFMTGSFSETTKRFQELASEYPELVVGPYSYNKYRYYALNPIAPSTKGTCSYCHACFHERIDPYLPKLEAMSPRLRDKMRRALSEIHDTQTSAGMKLANEFLETLQHPRVRQVSELESTAFVASYLASAQALAAFPQIDADHLARAEQFVRSLRLYHPSAIDLKQYLDLATEFRGVLSSVPSTDDQIVNEVRKINEEVAKIESSKRLGVGSFAWRLARDLPSLFFRLLTHGSFGSEGAFRISGGYRSSRATRTKAVLLSNYFGVSETGVYVWQIRKRIAKHSA